jgi:hypothetical protein
MVKLHCCKREAVQAPAPRWTAPPETSPGSKALFMAGGNAAMMNRSWKSLPSDLSDLPMIVGAGASIGLIAAVILGAI